MPTSWGQRKVLRKRSSYDDSGLRSELDRLQREYNLGPTRAETGMQADYDAILAQQADDYRRRLALMRENMPATATPVPAQPLTFQENTQPQTPPQRGPIIGGIEQRAGPFNVTPFSINPYDFPSPLPRTAGQSEFPVTPLPQEPPGATPVLPGPDPGWYDNNGVWHPGQPIYANRDIAWGGAGTPPANWNPSFNISPGQIYNEDTGTYMTPDEYDAYMRQVYPAGKPDRIAPSDTPPGGMNIWGD